ncbi:hypothetical protein FA15DRAFT_661323, partial [Coprinopsis marcescibilis]
VLLGEVLHWHSREVQVKFPIATEASRLTEEMVVGGSGTLRGKEVGKGRMRNKSFMRTPSLQGSLATFGHQWLQLDMDKARGVDSDVIEEASCGHHTHQGVTGALKLLLPLEFESERLYSPTHPEKAIGMELALMQNGKCLVQWVMAGGKGI